MDPLTLAMLGSTALSTFGSIKAGKAEKQAAYDQAKLKEASAREMKTRALINKRALGDKAQQERGEVVQNITSSGFTADSSLSFLNASLHNELLAQRNIDRETDYEVAILNAEAASLRKSGKASQTAGILRGGGSILSGVSAFQQAGGYTGMENRMIDSYGI